MPGRDLRVRRSAAAGIIAEGDKVHRAFPQGLRVLRLGLQGDAGPLHPLPGPEGVFAVGLHVDEEVVVPVPLHGQVHVLGRAGVGVELACRQHAAHHGAGHHLVGQAHRPGAGQQLVMGRLVFDLFPVLARLKDDACPHERHMQQHVDLVEGQPVPHQAAVRLKQHPAVPDKGVHHPAVLPPAVLLDQGDGGVEVADGDQRLDAVFAALLEHAAVKGDACGVGLRVVPVGEDTGPCHRHPVALEAHLRKQGDVLFVMVVQVDRPVGRVDVPAVAGQHFELAPRHGAPVRAKGHHVHAGQAPAVLVVSAFALVGRGRAAPQEAFGHFHSSILTF